MTEPKRDWFSVQLKFYPCALQTTQSIISRYLQLTPMSHLVKIMRSITIRTHHPSSIHKQGGFV